MAILFLFLFPVFLSCGGSKSVKEDEPWKDHHLKSIRKFLLKQSAGGHVRSFYIPECDPLSLPTSRVQKRVYAYDAALTSIALTLLGESETSEKILDKLGQRITPEGVVEFSYDVERGFLGRWYARTGSLAWVGYAFLYSGELFMPNKIFSFLKTLQVNTANGFSKDDPRYGLILGGLGNFEGDSFQEGPVEWVSTRHNIEVYYFLKLFIQTLGASDFSTEEPNRMLKEVGSAIMERCWINNPGRFVRGLDKEGIDEELALSDQVIGALFLISQGLENEALRMVGNVRSGFMVEGFSIKKETRNADVLNCQYESKETFSGLKPYLNSGEFQDPPELIWVEGTFLYLMVAQRLGLEENELKASMDRLGKVTDKGGFLYSTRTRKTRPYEFHTWESVAASAWAVLFAMDQSLPIERKIFY